MDNTIPPTPPVRPDIVSVETTPRPTAPKMAFSEVLAGGARSLVNGAQSVVQSLPASPLMALAVRPGSTGLLSTTSNATTFAANTTPEGPGGAVVGTGATGTSSGSSGDSLQQTMAQDEQMNMYYLQVQEQVDAQNRVFTTLSNVLEVENNTAKNAISNIH